MNDRRVDDIVDRWRDVSAEAARLALAREPRRMRGGSALGFSVAAFAVCVLVIAVVVARQQPSEPPGTIVGAGNTATPTAALGTATPSSLAPGSPTSTANLATAASTARAFETARAAGNWSAAWALLSAYSQAQYGSVAKFGAAEATYNASGGSTFTLADPSRDPGFLDPAFLGAPGADARINADFGRAAVVFANHPKVNGASEASRAYLIAPIASGVWQVWVVR